MGLYGGLDEIQDNLNCFVPETSQVLPSAAFQDTRILMKVLTTTLTWALFGQ